MSRGIATTHSLAWQAQSLLLAYPDETLTARIDLLRRAVAALPAAVGAPLHRFLDHVNATPLNDLAVDYVATFDHRKRCCLFLTYYAHGDTRKRGMALLTLKQTYAAAGLILTDDELPDHLCVVLEFAATGEPAAGRQSLLDHRAGIELLRLALRDTHSPWADVLDSVSATLPPLIGDERDAIARLAAQGPPEEQVGLAPFAPPEYMPTPQGARR
jgi:nitrate reductase molybdenum cofactor assembly chaperone NarJ/NarW